MRFCPTDKSSSLTFYNAVYYPKLTDRTVFNKPNIASAIQSQTISYTPVISSPMSQVEPEIVRLQPVLPVQQQHQENGSLQGLKWHHDVPIPEPISQQLEQNSQVHRMESQSKHQLPKKIAQKNSADPQSRISQQCRVQSPVEPPSSPVDFVEEPASGPTCDACFKSVPTHLDLFEGICRECSGDTSYCRRCRKNTPLINHQGMRECYLCRSLELRESRIQVQKTEGKGTDLAFLTFVMFFAAMTGIVFLI